MLGHNFLAFAHPCGLSLSIYHTGFCSTVVPRFLGLQLALLQRQWQFSVRGRKCKSSGLKCKSPWPVALKCKSSGLKCSRLGFGA
mmetsp:Transcript_35916/g.70591  ORF Transcript_35916/g.70591 Transcript_35916/m.70591 type:complete len:85 (+) Transcript_35916:1400-1654(+)